MFSKSLPKIFFFLNDSGFCLTKFSEVHFIGQMLILHNYHMQLLSGGNHDIDVDDLRNNTRYSGGYSHGSRTIKIFWEVFDFRMEFEWADFPFVCFFMFTFFIGFHATYIPVHIWCFMYFQPCISNLLMSVHK